MKRFAFCIIIAIGLLNHAYAMPSLEPVIYQEDFESGAVGPWAAYPPSQDTAYDPSIRVLPLLVEKNAPNRALYREITPNYEIDYEFGVRKLLDMYVDSSSVLTFRAYIKSYRGVAGVRVRFGFADSTMAELLVPFTDTAAWKDCRLPFAGILKPGEMKHLTAVALMAVCPNADPETLLRFGVDDVRITGRRERHFAFSEPKIHRLEEWPDFIAGTHFSGGGTVTIAGIPPIEAKSVIVHIARALTGGDDKTFTMKRSGDRWSCTIPLDGSKAGIGPGFWRATVSAGVKEGETFTTNLVFLVRRKDAPEGHPALYFSKGDIDSIMENTKAGHGKQVWEEIQNRAVRTRSRNSVDDFGYKFDAFNDVHWLPVFGDFGRELRTPQDYIRDNAVVYGLTGDTTAGDAARRALLKVSEWSAYVPPHILNQGKHSYYITGIFLTDLALGYDLLYDRLTPGERRKVAGALYSKGVREIFEEYVRGNWVSSNTSNWICDVTAGSILCAAAVYGDYGDEALEPYLTGSILKVGELVRDAFDKDGDYGEGSLYYMHTLHGLTKSMAVLDRLFGMQFPEKISRSHTFLLYQFDPETKRIYTFGDAYESLMGFGSDSYLGMGNAAYLLAKYRDPYLKWLYDFNPGTTERDLFFADDSIEAKPPDGLPTVKLFGEVGTTVFRSGFSHDDFVFVFRCGPFVNHQHFDQGGFFLADRGDEFLGEMGRSDYYDDLWYQKLITQPGGHNCILVDGNPESQRHGDFLHDVPAWNNYASTTGFFTFDGGAFVSGRLDPLYMGKMKYLRRNVLYLEPRTVILIDEATGTPGVSTIDLRFHAPFLEDITVDGRDARITRPAGTLTIRTVAPDTYRAEIMRRPMTLREIGDKRPENMKKRGFLQLSTAIDSGPRNGVFVNVLSTDSGVTSSLDGQLLPGHAVISYGGVNYSINTSVGGRYSEGVEETDALVFATQDNGFLALWATAVAVRGLPSVSADKPVSLLLRAGETVTLSYTASEPTSLALKGLTKPKRVTCDGKVMKGWKYSDGERLVIELPEGGGVVEIK